MLNRSASLAMSTSVLKALPGKLDIKRHSPCILYLCDKRTSRTAAAFRKFNYMVSMMKIKPIVEYKTEKIYPRLVFPPWKNETVEKKKLT